MFWHRHENYVLLRNGSTVQKYDCIKSMKNMAPFKIAFSPFISSFLFKKTPYIVNISNLFFFFPPALGNQERSSNYSRGKGQPIV